MRRRTVILAILNFSFFVFRFSFIFAQNVNTDSLQKVVTKEQDDTNKVNNYNDLSWGLKNKGMLHNADSIARLELYLAEKLNYRKGVADAWMNIGNVYNNGGDNLQALECFNKACEIRKEIGDEKGRASSLNNIGNIYDGEGDYPRAIDYYLEGLKVAEKQHDKVHMAMLYGNIGNVYNLMNEYFKSLDYLLKSVNMQIAVGDMIGRGYLPY